MVYKAHSSTISLILNFKFAELLTPWHIIIDDEEATITLRKRNRYLIGIDEKVIAFRYIKSISIDEHFIGANISIKVFGGGITAYYLSKNDAKMIKYILLNYNKHKKIFSIL